MDTDEHRSEEIDPCPSVSIGGSNSSPPIRWLIDGMNVIGARPDGWWRDRDGAIRRLVDRLGGLAEEGEAVTLVLDGRPIEGLPEGSHHGIEIVYARRGGADAADDRIVELAAAGAGGWTVVTSDRNLRGRVEALGCPVVGARALLDRLESGD